MAEAPFDLAPGRSGVAQDAPGVTITALPGLAVLSLIARKGQATALARKLGIALPDGPRCVAGSPLSAIGIGPGRWLLVGEAADEATDTDALCRRLAAEVEGLAAVADLSDAFPVLRLSGPAARALLAKGLPIDLHPRTFGPGDAATSAAVLVPLHLWQLDDAPTYEIAVPRSMAAHFADWLKDSAAEFGLLVAD